MKKILGSLLPSMVATAALAVAGAASAATYRYEFKTFYDTSTLKPADVSIFADSVANLTVTDIAGGAQLTLQFNNTAFPEKRSGSLYLDELWLSGTGKGSVSRVSGPDLDDAEFNRFGFLTLDGSRRNWAIEFDRNEFNEGEKSMLTIMGSGITAASLLAQAPLIELTGVGKPYSGFLGLNKSVRFIGTVAVPEPSTYALMGLGLVGVALAARKRQASW